MSGTCRFCVCTDDKGCEGGCSWVDQERTVCSLCFAAVEIVDKFLTIFAAVAPRARPPIALPAVAFADLILPQQALLVMACRRTVEQYRETLRDELADDAVAVSQEFGIIGDFLDTHFPTEVQDETESLSTILLRLLTPHIPARVVLATPADVRQVQR